MPNRHPIELTNTSALMALALALTLAACGGSAPDDAALEDDRAAFTRGDLPPPTIVLKQVGNPTLPDVVAAYQQLPTQGTRMGYRSGPLGPNDGILQQTFFSTTSHWEGVGRLWRGNYLVATSNIEGELWLVQLGSLGGAGRWPSNRPSGGLPPTSDTIVSITGPTRNMRVGTAGYTHAGGLSVIGDYVALGVEREGDPNSDSVVNLLDLSTPTNPRSIWSFTHAASSAGAIAIVRLPEGFYLLAVGGWGSATLDFYYSTTTDLENPGFQYLRRWTRSECHNAVAGDGTCFAEHQNLNFVLQSNGRLFLLGTNRDGSGDDWIDLLEVTGLPHGPASALPDLAITKIAKKHMYCNDGCSFKGGAGVYVDGTQLIVYATEMRRRVSDLSVGPWTRFNQF